MNMNYLRKTALPYTNLNFMLIPLKSIASAIDTKDGMIYATYSDGGIDADSGMHISEIPDAMIRIANEKDRQIIIYYFKHKQNGEI
jgi:hypothetical protein